MSKPAVTIYEIAKHVGVSPAAVSSTLANRHIERRLSSETVRKIREAATALGYVPNMAGRRLRAHKSATRQFDLAILTSYEAPLPLVGQVLHALQRAVDVQTTEHTRYAVAIEMFHAGRLSEKAGLLDANRYHGVILTNTLPVDDAFVAEARLPYPVVVLGRRIPHYHCVLEAPDFVGRRSAEVLLEAKCGKPGILHSRQLTHTTSDRLAAFTRVVKERTGREAAKIVSTGLQPHDGAVALEAFFSEGGQLDGLFAVNDSLAAGAYRAIKASGRRVPDDVAVVGIGDYELAEYLDPPLTTVAGANEAMVAEAVPMLFRLLRGEESVSTEVLVVPPVFMRQSTQRRA
ncbi:LacI family transcriptional regulator [Horticoccus luteus]|uniref:LacI family transcriptional regulator n=1 Tax=Horticoccus luteus TaxID=2862869 RepID=A0A8F9XKG4_9BACT|nr:LacI family DNA-binding transcriptional regulator [Horticoccus luteus]QYM78176.1 LacI family transcriptional regulator [Horticoccus luteus]